MSDKLTVQFMEYIFLGIYTFISIVTGIIVGVIWSIRARNAYSRKWFLGFIYIFISVIISSLIIQFIGTFLWILYCHNRYFDINDLFQTFYNTFNAWGLTSGFTTLIVFIIGIIIRIIVNIIKLFE